MANPSRSAEREAHQKIRRTNTRRAKESNDLALKIQDLLDYTAETRQYNDMNTLVSYAGSSNELWKNEALAGIAYRDALWEIWQTTEKNVLDNNLLYPTWPVLKATFPSIVW